MNHYFKIKRVVIKGSIVPPVLIEFGQKLTIITGGSDSGKTYFYNLIRYLLAIMILRMLVLMRREIMIALI